MRANKTDANDADGLAHLVRAGWYKEVRVKSRYAMLSKAVSAARRQLLDISTNLSNQVRGLMKTFGLVVPKGKGRIFEANVRRLLDESPAAPASPAKTLVSAAATIAPMSEYPHIRP
jgi:transposase